MGLGGQWGALGVLEWGLGVTGMYWEHWDGT